MKKSLTLGEIEAFEDEYNIGIFSLLRTCVRGSTFRTKHAIGLFRFIHPDIADIEAKFKEDPLAAYQATEDLLIRSLLPSAEAEEILAGNTEDSAGTDSNPSSAREG